MTWFKGFNGVRALAVLMVVFTHLGPYSWLNEHGLGNLNSLVHGTVGVCWFYVLSGFLITNIFLQEYRQVGKINVFNFYYRRALRILPLYFFVILLIFLSTLFTQVLGSRSMASQPLLYSLFYLYNFAPISSTDTWIDAFHSLATEEQFYLVFPVLFLFFRRQLALMTWILSLWIFATPFWASRLQAAGLGNYFFIDRFGFIAGASIGLGVICAVTLFLNPTFLLRSKTYVGVLGLLIFIFIYMRPTLPLMWTIEWRTPIACAIIILYLAMAQESWLVRFLEIPALNYLVKVSYGIYVWQSFILTSGPKQVNGWPLPLPYSLVLVILIVPFSYQFIEKPFLILRNHK